MGRFNHQSPPPSHLMVGFRPFAIGQHMDELALRVITRAAFGLEHPDDPRIVEIGGIMKVPHHSPPPFSLSSQKIGLALGNPMVFLDQLY